MLLWKAFQCVKANGGAGGIDRESIEQFENRLGDNLYKLWNRLCSGSCFPPPVKNIDHGLLMRALKQHSQTPWVLLYVERWLKAPMQTSDGKLQERTRGTPQGGVVSPLLANLFLHYAFDVWVTRNHRSVRFCRYADDGVVHCKSLAQAKLALARIGERFRACGLELHPDKTRIVYCQDVNRRGTHPDAFSS